MCVSTERFIHHLWSTVIFSVLMNPWYPGNFEVTMEKTCQSYSSMIASMSRASCWRAAPNWKKVDFSSCEGGHSRVLKIRRKQKRSKFCNQTDHEGEGDKRKSKCWRKHEWRRKMAKTGGDTERARDSVNKWDNSRVTASHWGAGWREGRLMVGNNSIITHRLDFLQQSVGSITHSHLFIVFNPLKCMTPVQGLWVTPHLRCLRDQRDTLVFHSRVLWSTSEKSEVIMSS